ncbi:MAG TPA: peptidylprolyl isomerase [Candidatus Coprenecus stercoravium]|uniref:Peptidyl-prolyl cis-trans isomerase n=1 Tax=Candidatus Coprenecus stercoravium TaxID=2840735 RepID=A0A9D2GP89_9BACT|nr:peptidylprolyl isomerase [Candidatus Coprenecus stercoravium]
MKSKIFILMLAGIIAAASCDNNNSTGGPGQNDGTDTTQTAPFDSTLAFNPADLPEEPVFEIHTNMGTITIMLYEDTPLHRDNFIKLASERFYDSLLFHRVIYGFMIQTGDPLTKDPDKSAFYGSGDAGYTIPAEILPNHTHKKGALAAARQSDLANPKKESSGSQFYIVQNEAACVQLDGEYTVFGETLDGFDVIDRIATVRVDSQTSRPLSDVRIIKITPVI